MDKSLLYYFLYFVINWVLLMQIFHFSSWHKYFKQAAVPLVCYGILGGYLLYLFNLPSYFLWHIFFCILSFYFNYSKQKKARLMIGSIEDDLLKKEFLLSIEKTLRYYIISVCIYLASFSVSFLFFYNS